MGLVESHKLMLSEHMLNSEDECCFTGKYVTE